MARTGRANPAKVARIALSLPDRAAAIFIAKASTLEARHDVGLGLGGKCFSACVVLGLIAARFLCLAGCTSCLLCCVSQELD